MYLSIIIPAYNEERRLTKTLLALDQYLRKQNYKYEILVVSDGSQDKTIEVGKSLVSRINNLVVSGYQVNRGKGYAVRFGMLKAKGDYRLFVDADNSTSIDQVEKLLPYFSQGYDLVIGSRNAPGAILDPPQPWIRRVIFGGGFKMYRKLIVGLWSLEDTQCGFKCFSKRAVESIFPRCQIDRFAFDIEILLVAHLLGYKMKEVAVCWKNDLESKVGFKSIFKMALDLIKIRINLFKGIYGKKNKN